MALKLALARMPFSAFKKKLAPLQTQDYRTPEDLYRSLASFEAHLLPLERKKMPKALELFGSKMRRLLRGREARLMDVEMELTHTYHSYSRNVDELIFGSEQVEVETSLSQMASLTQQMVKNDLTNYLKHLVPRPEAHRALYERLSERFVNVEERIARQVFRGYLRFSKSVSKVAFLEEREYKGDFKFEVTEDIPRLELAIQAIHNCALFNKMRDKLTLACELALASKWKELSGVSVARLLFCLANSGRTLKFIQDNFQDIKERVGEHPLPLLYYMMVSGIEDAVWLQSLSHRLTLRPTNIHEQLISRVIQHTFHQRFGCVVEVQAKPQFQLLGQKHEGELFLQDFLGRYGYAFTTTRHPMSHYTLYHIQGKKFMCLDHWAVKEEGLGLNGLGQVIRNYYVGRGEGMKHISWGRMWGMERRGRREEYILSKFKGVERPPRERVRYYQ